MCEKIAPWVATIFLAGSLGVLCAGISSAQPVRKEASVVTWRPVALGAGGLLTGIDIAPDGTKVVKADTFGAYIWNSEGRQWNQLITASSWGAMEAAGG